MVYPCQICIDKNFCIGYCESLIKYYKWRLHLANNERYELLGKINNLEDKLNDTERRCNW